MFRDGDPELTLAQWAIIFDYADAKFMRAVVDSFKKIPPWDLELLFQPLFPGMIYEPREKMEEEA